VPKLDLSRVASTQDEEYVLDESFTIDAPGFQGLWSRSVSGSEVSICPAGRVAARTRSAKSALVMGGSAYPPECGQYICLRIVEVSKSAVGALGIGFTCSPPDRSRKASERGYKLPNTAILGYWGCLVMGGLEYRLDWTAESAKVGDTVGLLATHAGDLVILVNDITVVVIAAALPDDFRTNPVYPVVDLHGSTVAVELLSTRAPNLQGKPKIYPFHTMKPLLPSEVRPAPARRS